MVVKFAVNPSYVEDLSPVMSNNGAEGVWVSIGPAIYSCLPAASLDELHISTYGDIFFTSCYSVLYGAFPVMVWGALGDA